MSAQQCKYQSYVELEISYIAARVSSSEGRGERERERERERGGSIVGFGAAI